LKEIKEVVNIMFCEMYFSSPPVDE